MPKPLHPRLFGKYLELLTSEDKRKLDTTQFVKPIPVKSYGRVPSRESQLGLFHDEDYNFYMKVSKKRVNRVQRLLKPFIMTKTFQSEKLNGKIQLPVTLSAMDSMIEAGGFDRYIERTPPEELRSFTGEKLRNLQKYYDRYPEYRAWGLPPKYMMHHIEQNDPWYARYKFFEYQLIKRRLTNKLIAKKSPYYLPQKNTIIGLRKSIDNQKINNWWTESPELETAFRKRLGQGKMFEKVTFDPEDPDSYRKGKGRGGGGPHGIHPWFKYPKYSSDVINK